MNHPKTVEQTSRPIVMAGGGTGGHIFPGLAVADALVTTAATIRQAGGAPAVVWIGSKKGMEREIVARAGYEVFTIPAGKLRRYISLKNLIDIFRVLFGIVHAWLLLGRIKPALLFSKGGYVSVPPVIAARMRGIPIVTHESDADPGLATRIILRFADKVCIPYEEGRKFYAGVPAAKLVVTGNPVRLDLAKADESAGLRFLGIKEKRKPILLAMGGSQGARRLNDLITSALDEITPRWTVVHQTGYTVETSQPRENGAYLPVAFLGREYPDVLAAADVVVCRAGASSLWEVAAMSKPMVLLPLGTDYSRGEQLRNAELFEKRGAAFVINPDDDPYVQKSMLVTHLAAFERDNELMRERGLRARALCRLDGAQAIAQLIFQTIGDES